MEIPTDLTSLGTEQFSYEQAENYIQTAREIYRSDVPGVDYRGARSEHQREIARGASGEANDYFNAILESTASYVNVAAAGTDEDLIELIPSTDEEADYRLGEADDALSIVDMRSAWVQLWTAFNVLSERLATHSKAFRAHGMKSLDRMKPEERFIVMQQLFNDFQESNALRFGAKTVGLMTNERSYDFEQDKWVHTPVDKDKAKTDLEFSRRAAKLGYSVVTETVSRNEKRRATHTAGKHSPQEIADFRSEYPEVDLEQIMNDMNFYKDAVGKYREKTD